MGDKLPDVDQHIDEQFDSVKWLKHPIPEARKWMKAELHRLTDSCRRLALDLQTGFDLGVAYGDSQSEGHGQEAFDWFPPRQWPCTPGEEIVLVIFLHGGYWQALDLPESSHWATSVTQFGGIFAGLSYRLAPWQSLSHMAGRVSVGIGRVYEHTLQRLDSQYPAHSRVRLFLCGHSAGAQLALESMLAGPPESLYDSDNGWLSVLQGLLLISGVYDLRPIIYTIINKALGLRSEAEAWAVSPMRHFLATATLPAAALSVKYFLAWVEKDPPALVEQSERLVRLMETGGCNVKACFIQDEDHFSSILKLHSSHADDKNELLTEVLRFIGLRC